MCVVLYRISIICLLFRQRVRTESEDIHHEVDKCIEVFTRGKCFE